MLTGVPAGHAATRPEVSFRFASSSVAATTEAPRVHYTVTGVPRGGRAVLQRKVGTAGVWRTVLRLGRHRHHALAPAVGMGVWRYRVAIKNSSGHTLATKRRRLRSYAHLPLGDYVQPSLFGGGSIVVGDRTFPYLGHAWFEGGQQIHADSTPCRTLHLDLGVPTGGSNDWVWTATVYQESQDPLSAAALPGQISALDAPIVPGQSWAFEARFSSTNPNPEGETYLYYNGWLDCYAAPTLEVG
jgi:hypothetical protein